MSNREGLEAIRRKTFLGSKLDTKDPEYREYVGSSYELGKKIALINYLLSEDDTPIELKDLLNKFKRYLEHQRKAQFNLSTDIITRLAILVGEQTNVRSATKRDIPYSIGESDP